MRQNDFLDLLAVESPHLRDDVGTGNANEPRMPREGAGKSLASRAGQTPSPETMLVHVPASETALSARRHAEAATLGLPQRANVN
jgi:hypothetical protein